MYFYQYIGNYFVVKQDIGIFIIYCFSRKIQTKLREITE